MLFLLKSRKNYSNVIKNNGCARIIKDILGKNNLVIIGKNSLYYIRLWFVFVVIIT